MQEGFDKKHQYELQSYKVQVPELTYYRIAVDPVIDYVCIDIVLAKDWDIVFRMSSCADTLTATVVIKGACAHLQ